MKKFFKRLDNKYTYLGMLIFLSVLVFLFGCALDILELANPAFLNEYCIFGALEMTYRDFLSWSYFIAFVSLLCLLIWQLFVILFTRFTQLWKK